MLHALCRISLGLAVLALGVGVGCARPAAAPPTAPAATPPLRHLQLNIQFRSLPYAWYFIAADQGYFTAEGLDVEFTTSSNDVASVLSGELDFATSGSAALSAILKGAPLKMVLANMDRPGYELWTNRADVASLADLKGQQVGVSTRGDTMEVSTRLMLAKAGLDPDSVAYTALGPGDTRLAALQSGSLAAAVLGVGDAQKFQQLSPRARQVANYTPEVRLLFNAVAASDRVLTQDRDLATRFLRATIKGREFFKQHKEETLRIAGQYNGAPREVNEPEYDNVMATITQDGTVPEEVQRSEAQVRATLIGAPSVRPLGEVFDFSLAKQIYAELRQSGWAPTVSG